MLYRSIDRIHFRVECELGPLVLYNSMSSYDNRVRTPVSRVSAQSLADFPSVLDDIVAEAALEPIKSAGFKILFLTHTFPLAYIRSSWSVLFILT